MGSGQTERRAPSLPKQKRPLKGPKAPTIPAVKIGESIRRKEVKTSWTQEQLAPEAGIIEKALCRIESNEVEPRFCGFGS